MMSAQDPLCCCEFLNKNGERTHVLACCCDCEAFDEIADNCFKCKHVPNSTIDRFVDTLLDRIRIPGLSGGGAKRINPEIATPIILIPASLAIAAIGPITTCIVLFLLPFFCLTFYRTWKRKTNKPRTKFFLAWGVSSLMYMYVLFELIVCQYTSITLFENLTVTECMFAMSAALYWAKQDPGILKKISPDSQTMSPQPVQHHTYDSGVGKLADGDDVELGIETDFERDAVLINIADTNTDVSVSNEGLCGEGLCGSWCSHCGLEKSGRVGHCPVCNVCVARRDHHCVWIDSCIGSENHRSFLVAMALFVFTGYYGCYLTLAATCDPYGPRLSCGIQEYYRDFKWAVCFVSAVYVSMVTTVMAAGLVHQIILISQNTTSQELHIATSRGQTKYLLFHQNNPYDKGFINNWVDFIKGNHRMSPSSYMKLPVLSV